MKLNRFNGGLNIRQAPELIAPNEAIICNNVKLSSGQLESAQGLEAFAITTVAKPFYFLTEDTWMPDADTRDYIEYQGKLYWTDGVTAKKYSVGVTHNLGIKAPATIKATLGATGVLSGVLQYVYTYYNADDGTESQPSPLSAEVTATAHQVNVDVTASADPQVTNIIVYRIGGTLTAFTKVVELANITTTYADNTPASSLATVILNSEFNGKAPAGLKYLSYSNSVFFGAVGTKLYFTRDIGNPNYWPETNYIDFRADITGIGIATTGIIVFSRYQAFIITGTNAATFIRYPLSGDQGCVSHKSITELGGAILFMSTDGICTATGSGVTVTSKFKLGKQNYNPVNAVVHDEEYLCQLTDNSIISLDLRYEPAVETYDFNTTWLAIANDTLYGEQSTGMHEMFAGSQVTYSYSTGNLTEGMASELKTYDDVYFYVVGTHTVIVYINDIPVATKQIVGAPKPQHLAIPQEKQRGSYIRFEMTGIGTIKEIEYVAERRENG